MLNHVVYPDYHILSQILEAGHLTQGHIAKKMWLAKLIPNISSKALALYGVPGTLVLMRRAIRKSGVLSSGTLIIFVL